MKNILIVTETKGFLQMSIKTFLQNASYHVIVVPADMAAIEEVKEPLSFIMFYCDEALNEKYQPLYFLKDQAVAYNIPIAIVGHTVDLEKLKEIIPQAIIQFEFAQPIDVRKVVEKTDAFIQQHDLHKKAKILAVDDSGTMLRTVKGWLEERYDVILANSGTMAIKYLTLNRPDLVLLDYEMPVVDGKTVLEMIRTETDFADIPVIFLTNIGDKESIMKVMELKPEGYLLKSYEPEAIIKAVDDFFTTQKAMI